MTASDTDKLTAALDLVREATRRRARTEESNDAAIRHQTSAIREAIAAGVSTLDLAQETGMSRARIYQIRDGRR